MKRSFFSSVFFVIIILLTVSCKKSGSSDNFGGGGGGGGGGGLIASKLTIYRSSIAPGSIQVMSKYQFVGKDIFCYGTYNDSLWPIDIQGFVGVNNSTKQKEVYISSSNNKVIYIYGINNLVKDSILISISSSISDTILSVYRFNWSTNYGDLTDSYLLSNGNVFKYSKSGYKNLDFVGLKGSNKSTLFKSKLTAEPTDDELKDNYNQSHEFFSTYGITTIVKYGTKVLDSLKKSINGISVSSLWDRVRNNANNLIKSTLDKINTVEVATTQQSEDQNIISEPDIETQQGNTVVDQPVLYSIYAFKGFEQTGFSNTALATNIQFVVTDNTGNPVDGIQVKIEADHGGSPNGTFTTYGGGLIDQSWVAGEYLGTQSIKASIVNQNVFTCTPCEAVITAQIIDAPDEFFISSVDGPNATGLNEYNDNPYVDVIGITLNPAFIVLYSQAIELRYNFNPSAAVTTWAEIPSGSYSLGSNYPSQFSIRAMYTVNSQTKSYYGPNLYNPSLTGTLTINKSGNYLSGSFTAKTQGWADQPTDPISNVTGTFKIKKEVSTP